MRPIKRWRQNLQEGEFEWNKNAPQFSRPANHMNKWPAEMTHHSKLVIHNDPTNSSHLSPEDRQRIQELQVQIDELKATKPSKRALTAYEIFENKHFNSYKAKFPH